MFSECFPWSLQSLLLGFAYRSKRLLFCFPEKSSGAAREEQTKFHDAGEGVRVPAEGIMLGEL